MSQDLDKLGLPPDVVDRILSGQSAPEDVDKEQRAAELERIRIIAANYRGVFNTPAGQFVLKHLREITIEQSCFVPGIEFPGADGLSAAQNGFMREGQNSIVREIERYLAWEDPEA